jgi:4-alpha-glucanotransferase
LTHSPDERYAAALSRAAADFGIADHYWDVFGRRHDTSQEIAARILAAAGYDTSTAEALEDGVEARRLVRRSLPLPPAIVAVISSGPVSIPLQNGFQAADLQYEIVAEDGAVHRWSGAAETPPGLAPGYHRLRVQWPAHGETHAQESHLIICPERAYLSPSLAAGKRRAGLAISLFGVRGAKVWGCGDFTALCGIIDWVAREIGGDFIALNPLQAIHNRHPYNTSPYLPDSIFYRNFIYLDVEAVPEFAASNWARRLRGGKFVQDEIARLNASEFVDYEGVARLKRGMLRALFRTFYRDHYLRRTSRAGAFEAFRAREGARLERFALYCALDEHLHRRHPDVWVWTQWPESYRNPASEACQAFARENPRSILFHQYVQWLLDEQAAAAQSHAAARGMEIGLFHDMPLATDRFGFELWAHGNYYVAGCRVGAPPDEFAPHGQDWSFPPPDRERYLRDGYRHFAESIRASARHGGALRIDHVMRLFRLYWIPDGFDATCGAYVRDNAEDLLRVLALESVRNRVVIIGEDLGTVEPEVRQALERFGILGYRLLYFERTEDGGYKRPEEYPRQALVSSTTHDLPTLAGFWSGRDIDARHQAGVLGDGDAYERAKRERQRDKQRMLDHLFSAGLLPDTHHRVAADIPELTGEIHNAITEFLASTPSMLLTLNQEDLTKEPEQQNLPGTVHQYPNWRRKMRYSVEELTTSKTAGDFARMFRNCLERTGRIRG